MTIRTRLVVAIISLPSVGKTLVHFPGRIARRVFKLNICAYVMYSHTFRGLIFRKFLVSTYLVKSARAC